MKALGVTLTQEEEHVTPPGEAAVERVVTPKDLCARDLEMRLIWEKRRNLLLQMELR